MKQLLKAETETDSVDTVKELLNEVGELPVSFKLEEAQL